MADRKLDMGKAWTQATGLIGSNRDSISAVAGLFFFLPTFAISLFVPELANPAPPSPAPGGNPEAVLDAMMTQISAAYAENWALILATMLVQFVGSMSLFALLSDRGNPTVGEALGTGLKSIPAYVAAQLLSALGAAVVVGVPLGILAALTPPAVTLLAAVLAMVVIIYLAIKFSLTAPVIAIEGTTNPITALLRSWRLTKGNSFRILLFLALLLFTIGIISALVSGLLSLVLSAIGEPVATLGNDIVSALINALLTVVFLVVTVAIHRQLAGPTTASLAATFE
ncbi:MAG: glycerophosphoryl diester phosphodiesterase membrane domain-containing protein [Erythrobacter sp.]